MSNDTYLKRQAGEHYLVTGAGTGIGRAIALRLAREGASLSLLARGADRLAETAAAAEEAGAAKTLVVCADIQDRAAVDAAVEAAAAALGPLRGVIANSGIGGPNAPGEGDRFDELVQTNLVGTYSCLRAAQRHLKGGPEPRHMVIIASILGRIGVAGYTGYCASKTGLIGLSRALAQELAEDNVQVNAICPGWVETEMAREGITGMAAGMGISYEAALAEAMKPVPLGRMSQPHHIAGLVAWLVSEDGVGVTGQSLDMNNGAWMG
ncbi:MAG: NAD(P)-dependent dehydrogenase (short-subunit alcohol dehydrogenase family) [Myxococcota bacterium]|jgi:NAD(P)-dependent dehydrogenase (short-subunit alcohol dehydrogenase family)